MWSDASDGDRDLTSRAKQNALRLALKNANAEVVELSVLALVDLQGVYLRLHDVLSKIEFPIESGAVIGRLALLQINSIFGEIKQIFRKKYGAQVGILQDLYDSIEIELVDGKAYLAKELNTLKDGKYLNINPSFEVFYALPPLAEIDFHLRREARNGSNQAKRQLELIKEGRIALPNFERDYRYFSDFLRTVKSHPNCAGSSEGFFSWMVDHKGLSRWDEKGVDTEIVIRAMEALYEKSADVLCVISSDQDFIPLSTRCEKFGVEFVQKDAAKFFSGTHVGREIRKLGDNYIAGTFNPDWPVEILTECMRPVKHGGFELSGLTDREARALVGLHNQMSEYKINLESSVGSGLLIAVERPVTSDVKHRVDARTQMRQLKIERLKY